MYQNFNQYFNYNSKFCFLSIIPYIFLISLDYAHEFSAVLIFNDRR